MKSKVWLSKALMASLVMAVAAIGVSAQTYRRYSEREIYELAQRNGYREGVREARLDRREGRNTDYRRARAYRDGKYGYRDEYRHDGTYKDGFRNGFVAGYRDGYNGNNNGNDRWNNGRYNDRNDDRWNNGRYNDRDDRYRRNGSWGDYDNRNDDYNRRDNRNNNRRYPYWN